MLYWRKNAISFRRSSCLVFHFSSIFHRSLCATTHNGIKTINPMELHFEILFRFTQHGFTSAYCCFACGCAKWFSDSQLLDYDHQHLLLLLSQPKYARKYWSFHSGHWAEKREREILIRKQIQNVLLLSGTISSWNGDNKVEFKSK